MEFNYLDILQHLLNIIVLYVLLRILIYKPVRAFMQKREETIRAQLDGAGAQLEEANALKARYEDSMKEAEIRADGIVRDGVRRAEDSSREILDRAKSGAEAITAEARVRAEEEAAEILGNMRAEVAGLAVEIASRILEREISAEDNRVIIDRYFDRVGEKP